jgi:pimeloyl-ACP methyl ester carboxylesterase
MSLAVLGIAVTGTGAIYQAIATKIDQYNYPPPGKLVQVNDHKLHILTMGENQPGPTVVLESGLGGPLTTWHWVQPEVAKFARVVSYDRAGLGWSEDSQNPINAQENAQQLYSLLQKAGIKGPYILVGHSAGGLYIRKFTKLYPNQVAGLVFVDSSHPEQIKRAPASGAKMQRDGFRQYHLAPFVAYFGILRLTGGGFGGMLAGYDLPPQTVAATQAVMNSVVHLHNQSEEAKNLETSMAQVGNTSLGDRPVIVLSAHPSEKSEMLTFWLSLHPELAKLSTKGSHRLVEGADHFSILLNQNHAQNVISAIQEVVNQVRANQP